MFSLYFLVSFVASLILVARYRFSGPINLHEDSQMYLVFFSLLLFYLLYFLVFKFTNWNKIPFKKLIIYITLINIIFLIIPFLTSNDLNSYIFQSRVFSRWRQNPYLVTYDTLSSKDEFYFQIQNIWSSKPALYGPLFLLIGSAINILGINNLFLTTNLFKFLIFSANIANVSLIYKITNQKPPVFLYGANPLVIFELSANKHLESLLIFAFLISLYFLKKHQPIKSLFALTASFLIKYSTIIAFPLYITFLGKNKASLINKTLRILFAILLSGSLVLLTYIPFWQGFKIFDYLKTYYSSQFISPSPLIWLFTRLTGSYQLSFQINTFLFVIFYIFTLIKIAFKELSFDDLIYNILLVYFLYLFSKLSLVLTWYLTPLLALSAIVAINKDYKSKGYFAITTTHLYSLILIWFVR